MFHNLKYYNILSKIIKNLLTSYGPLNFLNEQLSP